MPDTAADTPAAQPLPSLTGIQRAAGAAVRAALADELGAAAPAVWCDDPACTLQALQKAYTDTGAAITLSVPSFTPTAAASAARPYGTGRITVACAERPEVHRALFGPDAPSAMRCAEAAARALNCAEIGGSFFQLAPEGIRPSPASAASVSVAFDVIFDWTV